MSAEKESNLFDRNDRLQRHWNNVHWILILFLVDPKVEVCCFCTSGVTKQNRKNKDKFRTGFLKHSPYRPLVKPIDSPVLTSYHWLILLQCQAGQDACFSFLCKSTTVTPNNYNTEW